MRELFIDERDAWPAAWPDTERLKFLSRDRKRLFKFEGHGPYGEAVRRREQLLAANGFGERYRGHEAGFGIHELVQGRQASPGSPSLTFLRYVATYCAWRATVLPASVGSEETCQLTHMAAFNVEQEFGFAPELHLEVERPAICDGRMQHYEWRERGDDHWVKLDASTHGDDHFFPGPTDIAWDLAAVCVEWQLGPDYCEYFLSEYRRLSGDDPAPRLQPYEIAYAAFRLGWSRMAADSVSGAADQGGLLQDAVRYRAVLERILTVHVLAR